MSATRNKFSPEFRDRAVRMVAEHRGDYPSEWAAMTSIAGKIGFTAETLRRSVRREERDAGRRAGPSAEIEKTLKYVQQLSRTIEQEMNTVLLDCTRARRAALRKMGPRGVTRHRPLPQALSTARFGMPTRIIFAASTGERIA